MPPKTKALLKITEEDLRFIYGEDYDFFREKILSNCFCHQCYPKKGVSTITNYDIFIADLDDIILRGFCADCGGNIARYLETGEVKEYLPRIQKIKENFKKNRIKLCQKPSQKFKKEISARRRVR